MGKEEEGRGTTVLDDGSRGSLGEGGKGEGEGTSHECGTKKQGRGWWPTSSSSCIRHTVWWVVSRGVVSVNAAARTGSEKCDDGELLWNGDALALTARVDGRLLSLRVKGKEKGV